MYASNHNNHINSEAQFKRLFDFLARNRWIHNFPVTKIFKNKCLEKIPSEWLLHLRSISIEVLNTLPLCTKDFVQNLTWPPSLLEFLSEASQPINHTQYNEGKAINIDETMARGMSMKKLHEVSRMAPLVDDIVRQGECNLILDIGSGLGYLAHVLHKVYGHKVVGLETSDSHLTSAERRAVNQDITCSGFKSVKFNVSQEADCIERFEKLIEELATTLQVSCSHVTQAGSQEQQEIAEMTDDKLEPRVCLIGLHCCGDLSSAVISMFNAVRYVRALCCVCCCYHKMAYSEGCFPNFPMSQIAKLQYNEVKQVYPNWHVSPYTLRIGAQQARGSWANQSSADHANHTHHVAFRGLLEMLDYEDTKDLRQRVRKSDFSSFTSFLDSCFPLQESDVKHANYRAKLTDLYKEHEELFDLIEVFTCLQVILQPLIEKLIYEDRVQWLIEKGHSDVKVIAVFNDKISPRNLAIVANKI